MSIKGRRSVLRGFSLSALAFAMALSGAPVSLAHDDDKDRDEDKSDSRIARGFEIAPVHLNLQGKNRALVGLGSYIVNAVGGCNDCHTQPSYQTGGDPFMGQQKRVNTAGYLAGGRVFFGPIISRNVTPNHAGLPAGLTLHEFVKLIRTGIDPDAAHPQFGPFLQVMPWPVYQDMTDRDLRAVYEYLRSIPCIEGDPGAPPPTSPRC